MTSADLRPSHTDIHDGTWVDRWLPARLKPYARLARLDRPIGTWLLLFPGWWAIALATPAGGWPDFWLMTLFGVGAVVMRGAGCTVNDILDRKLDAQVERTRIRPLPSGQVTTKEALAFLALQLVLGFLVLIQLNWLSIWLGVASLALVFTYPLMKRITWWPQAFLGLTFNWGALMGWTAVHGEIDAPALLLYAGCILWTLGYDTIYAHQDKEDDARVGIRSTALLFGARSKRWVAGFYLGALLVWAAALGPELFWPAAAPPFLVAGLLLFRQWRGWNPDDPADSLATFKASRFVGWAMLAAIVAGSAAEGMAAEGMAAEGMAAEGMAAEEMAVEEIGGGGTVPLAGTTLPPSGRPIDVQAGR